MEHKGVRILKEARHDPTYEARNAGRNRNRAMLYQANRAARVNHADANNAGVNDGANNAEYINDCANNAAPECEDKLEDDGEQK